MKHLWEWLLIAIILAFIVNAVYLHRVATKCDGPQTYTPHNWEEIISR